MLLEVMLLEFVLRGYATKKLVIFPRKIIMDRREYWEREMANDNQENEDNRYNHRVARSVVKKWVLP